MMTYQQKLAQVRAADARHEETMNRVAKRASMTLNQIRSLCRADRDATIFRYGDHRYGAVD